VVVAGAAARDAVGEGRGSATAAEGGAVVVGATACGCKSPIGSCDPDGTAACRGGIERRGTGSSAVRTTKVSAITVTAATRADVPMTGRRGSKTPQRVSELDTPWLSASLPSPLKSSPSVVADAPTFHRVVALRPRIPTARAAVRPLVASAEVDRRVDRQSRQTESTERVDRQSRRKESTDRVDRKVWQQESTERGDGDDLGMNVG
jgi:hypothetical protein